MTQKDIKKTLFPFILFIMLCTTFCIISPNWSTSQDPVVLTNGVGATITIMPQDLEISPNNQFQVNIHVEPHDAIAGVQCAIHYDSSLINALHITEGNLFTQYSTYFNEGMINNTAGTIKGIVGVITTPGGNINESGTFATITFQSLSFPGISPVTIENALIGNIAAEPLTTQVNHGEVHITAATATKIKITPSSHSLSTNKEHIFSIIIDPITEIAGVQATLTFNPSLLTITDVKEGNMFGEHQYFSPPIIDNNMGKLTVSSVSTTIGGTNAMATVAEVTIKALATGGTTYLNLSQIIIGDPLGVPLPFLTENAIITFTENITKISLFPSTQIIEQGKTTLVHVWIDPTEPIAGAQFDLHYDSSLLTAEGVQQGDLFPISTSHFINGQIDDTQGIIHGVAGSLLGAESISSSGIFATITFSAKQTQGTSLLSFSNVIVGDINAQSLPIKLQSGSITISVIHTNVNISPAMQSVTLGEIFTVDIMVDPVAPISGVEFNLEFDSSLITATGVTEGDLFMGYATYFNNGTIDNINGHINDVWGVIAQNGGGTIASPGVFATITFTAGETYGTSPLNLYDVIVGTDNGDPVPLTINNGTIAVGYSHTFKLKEGWNIICMPFQTSLTAETLGSDIDTCDSIVKWDPVDDIYIGHPVGTEILDFTINPGMGYFVHVLKDTSIAVTGIPLDNLSISLSTGWNLIGWIHHDSTTAEGYGQTISGCDTVAKWNPVNQSYLTHPVNTPIQDFSISRGDGLFIHTNQDSTWHGG